MRASRNSLVDHTLGRYLMGLDNAAKQVKQYSREERALAAAYEAYLYQNRR